MKKTKYFFTIEKQDPPVDVGGDSRFDVPPFERKHQVFSVEVEAEEFIELMEHLWNIAQKRKDK